MFARLIENLVARWIAPISREEIELAWAKERIANDRLPPKRLRLLVGMLLPHEQAAQRKQR